MFQSATHKWLLQRVDYKHNFLLVYDFPKFSITRSQSFKSIKSMQQFIRRYKLVPDSNCIRFEVINNVFTPFTVIGTEKVYITKVLKLQAWSHEVNKAFASGEFRMLRLTD